MFDITVALMWISCLGSSILLSTAGVIPLALLKLKEYNCEIEGVIRANHLLGFALGCLLGEVFVHALPEHWTHVIPRLANDYAHQAHLVFGLQFISGIVTFFLIEHFARLTRRDTNSENTTCDIKKEETPKLTEKQNSGFLLNFAQECAHSLKNVHISGVLNLIANCTDNFTHGLAIGVSYLSGIRVGMITTFGILLHEIPHEVGDVAILLKSGFSFSQVFYGQLLTGSFGIVGALFSLILHTCAASSYLSAIRAFTAGGFLYVAHVSLLADLVKRCDNFCDLLSVLFGIAVMGTIIFVVFGLGFSSTLSFLLLPAFKSLTKISQQIR